MLSSKTNALLTHTLASFWRKQSCYSCIAYYRSYLSVPGHFSKGTFDRIWRCDILYETWLGATFNLPEMFVTHTIHRPVVLFHPNHLCTCVCLYRCLCVNRCISHLQPYFFIMPPPLGAGGIMFSGCPSVRPKPEIPSFDLYMGPLVHPTNRDCFTACPSVRPSVCPSVRPEWFPDICRRTHEGNGQKFHMLMYLDHLQNWLVYGHGLLIFLILALFWLSETVQIWGFRAFPGERMEEMAWNCAHWCILTTFRTD